MSIVVLQIFRTYTEDGGGAFFPETLVNTYQVTQHHDVKKHSRRPQPREKLKPQNTWSLKNTVRSVYNRIIRDLGVHCSRQVSLQCGWAYLFIDKKCPTVWVICISNSSSVLYSVASLFSFRFCSFSVSLLFCLQSFSLPVSFMENAWSTWLILR
jgi:hypothetical protein